MASEIHATYRQMSHKGRPYTQQTNRKECASTSSSASSALVATAAALSAPAAVLAVFRVRRKVTAAATPAPMAAEKRAEVEDIRL